MTAWIKYQEGPNAHLPFTSDKYHADHFPSSELVLVSWRRGNEALVEIGSINYKLHKLGVAAWYVIGTPYPITADAWMTKPQPFDGDGYES